MSETFRDRSDAGRRLAEGLGHLAGSDVIVLGLPRGGVPVAAEVAQSLAAPLDVIVVRKLSAPNQPELAIGAVGEGGVLVVNNALMRRVGVDETRLQRIAQRRSQEVADRLGRYRMVRSRHTVAGRVAVVVDDGIATGATAVAACRVARAMGAARVVLAVPVAPRGWTPGEDADEFVAVATPIDLRSVGSWYDDFTQTSDDEVLELLAAG